MSVELPNSGAVVDITYHNFEDIVYSLLSDEALMIDDHLLFHNNDPFSPPPPLPQKGDKFPYVYHDVNDGEVYRQAYDLYVKDFRQ